MKIIKLSQNPEYKIIPYNYLKSHWWDEVDLDRLFEMVLSDSDIPEFFLALDRDKVIWMVLVDFSFYEESNKPWLLSLYVLEKYRWKWVGWKLVKHLEQRVKNLWFSKIWLDSYNSGAYYERPEHNYTYYNDMYRKEDKYVKVYFKEL